MTDDRSQENTRRSGLSILLWGLTAFAIYVLSIGPVGWLMRRGIIEGGSIGHEVVMVVYEPLRWLTVICPPLGALIKSYVNFFMNM